MSRVRGSVWHISEAGCGWYDWMGEGKNPKHWRKMKRRRGDLEGKGITILG